MLLENNKHHNKNNASQNQRQKEQRSQIMASSFQILTQRWHSLVQWHDLSSSEQKLNTKK